LKSKRLDLLADILSFTVSRDLSIIIQDTCTALRTYFDNLSVLLISLYLFTNLFTIDDAYHLSH